MAYWLNLAEMGSKRGEVVEVGKIYATESIQ